MMHKIEDHIGRRFEKLRISLLNTCNFSCVYCVSDNTEQVYQGVVPVSKEEQLDPDEFVSLIQSVHQLTGLKSIRLTGGEPLLYMNLIPLIEKIKTIGIEDIRLTTNGYYLKQMARQLKKSGIQSINISIDAIDLDLFRKIARHNHPQRVFEGIQAAVDAGMQVKLNAVIMRGKNESQIVPLLDYASKMGVKIRYLELMKMGHLYQGENELFYSEKEILDTISQDYGISRLPRKKSETARYWTAGENRIFGIIANESTPFCHDCNRLRMDSRGYFYGCLSNANGDKLAPYVHDQELLTQKLRQLLLMKQPARFHGSQLSMRNIGG
ncbi:GTP 3',8-cyclase MoaA [uncultured Sunxiuqinia sp.]|uniref:GTP 3',8-cyclase MoaA n=1 Tax=uncultured Sunxiuqinia sp. TaxID=1573825 RepID=UPI0030DC4A3C|tara:strand:- start:249 stop:1223 length:975 start_codon:yes stop_codon:yes gene_type:complete